MAEDLAKFRRSNSYRLICSICSPHFLIQSKLIEYDTIVWEVLVSGPGYGRLKSADGN